MLNGIDQIQFYLTLSENTAYMLAVSDNGSGQGRLQKKIQNIMNMQKMIFNVMMMKCMNYLLTPTPQMRQKPSVKSTRSKVH